MKLLPSVLACVFFSMSMALGASTGTDRVQCELQCAPEEYLLNTIDIFKEQFRVIMPWVQGLSEAKPKPWRSVQAELNRFVQQLQQSVMTRLDTMIVVAENYNDASSAMIAKTMRDIIRLVLSQIRNIERKISDIIKDKKKPALGARVAACLKDQKIIILNHWRDIETKLCMAIAEAQAQRWSLLTTCLQKIHHDFHETREKLEKQPDLTRLEEIQFSSRLDQWARAQ